MFVVNIFDGPPPFRIECLCNGARYAHLKPETELLGKCRQPRNRLRLLGGKLLEENEIYGHC